MKQYIDKSALVAEIERRISLFQKEKKTEKWSVLQMNIVSLGARIAMLEEILSFLNTLEVKEVDLNRESAWKPSDDQMRALHDMNLTGNISYAGQGQTLIELYNDLKKL